MAVSLYTRAYQTTEAETADPRHTLVLLFDGLVRLLHQAHRAMSQGQHEAQCESIVRAQRIVSTLMASLDRDAAVDLAQALWAAYNWVHSSLTEASIRDDLALLSEVLDVALSLREAWRGAEKELRQAEQTAPAGRQAA